ncbi:MAG: pseudaminic acid synthase [Hyphomicrobiaceae bacterium]
MTATMTIDGVEIGVAAPPYIVAELSGNHNGDINRALELIDLAAQAGAHAVKLQTYTADTITIDHPGPDFLIEGGLWDGRRLYELYEQAHTPWDWHEALFAHARSRNITIFSTPFDHSAVDMLERLDAPAYKIASFEAVDLPLIRYVAATGKPMIISTGLTSIGEISDAVNAARTSGCKEMALLHCVSAYPAPASEMNLRTIDHIASTFKVVAGLSDHTLGTTVASAAVALGASIIEKHVTIRRSDGGPDAAFSLEPDELAQLVENCGTAHEALGEISFDRQKAEGGNLRFRRSLYAVSDIAEREALTADSVRSIRPGFGLAPKHLDTVIGKKARRPIARGTPLSWDLLE